MTRPTPVRIDNRAGLSQVARRVGNKAAFRESMLRALSSRHRPGLRGLGARGTDDWSIAFLDAWAEVCDILAFYNERIGNESYLSTATERFSIQELARLVDYELAPASAAETWLAFTADDTLPDNELRELPAPIAVKSVPMDDELPQSFETVETLRFKKEWNAVKPLSGWPQSLSPDLSGLYLDASYSAIRRGGIVVLTGADGTPLPPSGGHRVLRRVVEMAPAAAPGLTWLSFDRGATPAALPQSRDTLLTLAGDAEDLKRATTESFLDDLAAKRWRRELVLQGADHVGLPTGDLATTLATAAPGDGEGGAQALHLSTRCRLFGHDVVTDRADGPITPGPDKPSEVVDHIVVDEPETPPTGQVFLYLDRKYEELGEGMLLVLRGVTYFSISGRGRFPDSTPREAWCEIDAVETVSIEAYGISGEVTRLTVPNALQAYGESSGTLTTLSVNAFSVRGVALYAGADPVPLPDLPFADPIGTPATGAARNDLLIVPPDLDFAPGQAVILSGERADLPGVAASEVAVIGESYLNGVSGVLEFKAPLAHSYLRDSVTVAANVAYATHGETVEDVLGSGNAAEPFQTFTLKDKPLTYVSAATATGRASTVQIYVDGVRWHEVSSLAEAGPDQRAFRLHTLDGDITRVEFGDGITGLRLPTGEMNVTAIYRKGGGTEGRLRAGQLTLLSNKPLAIKQVTNPLACTGGSAAETMADARDNTRVNIMTLGRIVSLSDFEDFARNFAGITKARADWNWASKQRQVFLTVAGEDATPLPETGGVIANLADAIALAAAPDTAVHIANANIKAFTLSARIKVDPDFLGAEGTPDAVFAEVRAALADRFSFVHQKIGAPVRASEVVALIQGVAGVVAVDLDHLHLVTEPADPADILRPTLPSSGTHGAMDGAGLFILTGDPVTLEVMS